MSTSAPAGRSDVARWLNDPAEYARHVLRHNLWRTQAEIMRSVAINKRTAVKGCHASSKTFTAADVGIWWVTRFQRIGGIAVVTAPTWKQVELRLFGEIRASIAGAILQYPALGKAQLWMQRANVAGAKHDSYIIGISTNESARFAGFHGKILVIFDESAGIKPPIWEGAEGMRAGGDVRMLALGNPTAIGGPYYDAFTKDRDRWSTFTIDALDTPNTWPLGRTPDERLETLIRAKEEGDQHVLTFLALQYLVSPEWIIEKYAEWGIDSPQWESRVRGQFPTHAEHAVFPLAWLERAEQRELDDLEDADRAATLTSDLEVGIDPAGPGKNKTSVTITQRYHIVAHKSWGQQDARGPVAEWLSAWRPRIGRLKIDTTGIGYYFAQHFRDLKYDIVEINAESDPHFDRRDRWGNRRFADRKAEIYWHARDLFEHDEISGLTDQPTITQLSMIRWTPDSRGRIMIEPKEKAKAERGMESPDDAESLILALAPVRDKKESTRPPTTIIRTMR